MEERVKVELEIPKELYELVKEFCEWAGKDFTEYLEECIIENVKSDLDYLKSLKAFIPRVEEFNKKLKEIEETSSP
ncbi:conserved hypothetical protein [Ferroglobus placidus DSM 10642]|uniref:Uncharacterized protein n=1 Tax=Ferroglobus placidus (strain DSM 10642 / AEDII12DO) TaxID=589924 RepID=D3S0B4_FERPA|nr:hypothetical protein [Ferroglobus placidus]ADC66177.1 conserved hypothetical protein [Ferroglobus placidus DSM 10642]